MSNGEMGNEKVNPKGTPLGLELQEIKKLKYKIKNYRLISINFNKFPQISNFPQVHNLALDAFMPVPNIKSGFNYGIKKIIIFEAAAKPAASFFLYAWDCFQRLKA